LEKRERFRKRKGDTQKKLPNLRKCASGERHSKKTRPNGNLLKKTPRKSIKQRKGSKRGGPKKRNK